MNLIIERLKKTMRGEFAVVLIVFIVLQGYFFVQLRWREPQVLLLSNIFCVLLFILIAVSGIYYYRFFIFYRSISGYDVKVVENMRKFSRQLEINIAIHKTYNICVAPLAILVAIVIKIGASGPDLIYRWLISDFLISPWHLLIAFFLIFLSCLLSVIVANWYARVYYESKLALITQILESEPL